MMELRIDTSPQPLVVGASGDTELMQNVRIIASTFAYSVRFDAAFADMGDYVDSPLPLATARRIARLTDAIEKYEPRLSVVSIVFKNDEEAAHNGIAYPIITVKKRGGA